MIYVALSIVMAVLFLIENIIYVNDRVKKITFGTLLIIFLLISSIRWETGTDWCVYKEYFDNINSIKSSWVGDFEIGFRLYVYILRRISSSFVFYNAINAIIVAFCEYQFIVFYSMNNKSLSKQKNDALYLYSCPVSILACLWFLYFADIFPVRATLAMCILLVASKYAINGNLKQFLLLIILATLIQRVSIIYLVVYPLYNSKKNFWVKFYVYAPVLSIFFYFIGKPFLSTLIYIMPGTISYKLNYYINENPEFYGKLGIVNYFLLYFLFLSLYIKYYSENKMYLFLFNVYSVGMIPYVIGVTIAGQFIRASYVFMAAVIFLIPKIIQMFKNISVRIIVLLITILYLFMRLYSNLHSYPVYLPFKTIWS